MNDKQILVIGIVSPLGTKIDEFKNQLRDLIYDRYEIDFHSITLSDLMKLNFSDELNSTNYLNKNRFDKLKRKIELGNLLRKEYGRTEIFGEYALLKIADEYKKILTSDKKKHIIVVDQFKRPEEVRFLENILGHAFWLIGLTAPIEDRIKNISNFDSSLEHEVEKLVFVDENEESNPFGQRMRKTFLLAHSIFSDVFDKKEVTRFFDLLHGSHFVLPRPSEYFMNLAFNASLKSGDLSRQVGAVIVSEENNQISCGANEVNKFGGGNYWHADKSHTDLDIKFDPNKKVIHEIKEELKKRISESGLSEDAEKIAALLDKSKLDDLTEFHRATHAEMDAILSAHRNGIRTVGATIYCTTFPCHNCAKHIISSGISKIVYQEPYPKSMALRLHEDAISRKPKDKMVYLEEFLGLTHIRFSELFSMIYSAGAELTRKEGYLVKPFDSKNALFRFHINETVFTRLTSIALETFHESGTIRLDKIA